MVEELAHIAPGTERPLRADARRNRGRILEVAHDTFSAEGLGVPVDVIAQRAGVGVGTLYRHFPTKDALCTAILTNRMELLLDAAAELDHTDDPGEAFFAFLRLMADRSAQDVALAEEFIAAGVDLHAGTAEIKGRLIAALGELLAAAQAAGAVRPDVAAGEVLALMSAACMTAGKPGVDVNAGRVLQVVFDGLKPA